MSPIDVVSPLQGFRFATNQPTQGVALGWHIDAPLGLEPQMRNIKARASGWCASPCYVFGRSFSSGASR